jgi:hypothetical protein
LAVFIRLLATLCQSFVHISFVSLLPNSLICLFSQISVPLPLFIYFFMFISVLYIFIHLLATHKLRESLPAHHIPTLQLIVRMHKDMSVNINHILTDNCSFNRWCKRKEHCPERDKVFTFLHHRNDRVT